MPRWWSAEWGAALAVTGQPWFTPDHVIGLVLAVLACGMLLGSLVGGARGLLWLAIPLSLAGLAVSAVPMEQFRGGIGDVDAMPSTSAQVLPVYERTAGSIHVDLTQVTGDEPLTTAVRNGTGDITVVVPADADVTYTCEAQVGDLACFDQQRSGVRVPALKGVDLGDDGEGGRKIDLTVTTWMGNVEVHRG